ncbi:MAG: hypothetical protein ACRDNS_27545, partial [Trebonia sp.]
MPNSKAVASSLAVPVVAAAMAMLLPFMLVGAAGAAIDPADFMCGPGGTAQVVAGQQLDAEQMGNAATIVTTIAATRDTSTAATIALEAAYQASSLRNLPAPAGASTGDGDAIDADAPAGLFQLPIGYGPTIVLDPARATEGFMTRLLAVPGWSGLAPGQAAQAAEQAGAAQDYA